MCSLIRLSGVSRCNGYIFTCGGFIVQFRWVLAISILVTIGVFTLLSINIWESVSFKDIRLFIPSLNKVVEGI